MAANKPTPQGIVDNWNFALVGAGSKFPFRSYISSIDPTNAEPGVLVAGSQNVYVTLKQSVAVRPGLKRRGAADSTLAGVKSSTEWETSLGFTRPLRVANSKLQVEFDAVGDGTYLWYDLMTALTLTRFVFEPWWDDSLKKDALLFVKGDTVIHRWSGGLGVVAATSAGSGLIATLEQPSTTSAADSGGTGYVVGDVLGVTGGAATMYVDAISPGGVSALTVNGGSGYAANDVVHLDAPTNGKSCYIKILTVDGGGSVLTFAILSAGNGYTANTQTSIATTGGGGSALKFYVTATGNTITAWHLQTNGTGYSATSTQVVLTGGTGTGATLSILTVGAFAVTLAGNKSIAQLGFESGNTIVINGHSYTYTASNQVGGQSFVGLSSDPTGEAVGSVVLDGVTTSNRLPDPTNLNFTNDFIKVINNQLHVGSYNSRFVYVSQNTSYYNFTVPDVRAQGDPDLLTLDSAARGITVQKGSSGQAGNAIISGGLGDWYTVERSQITVGTDLTEQVTVTKSESADLATALAHEFITNVGDNIIFLDQNNQMREFGTVRNITTPVFPLLSLDIFTELKSLDFTGGHMRAVADEGGETVYITCPLSGTDYMYQIRQRLDAVGNLTAERLWQPPQVRGLSRIVLIDGITYGHSNANPQLYQLWDTQQWHDDSPSNEPLPYEAHQLMAYLNGGRTNFVNFDKLFVEGYMTMGTALYAAILEEYQGSKFQPNIVINNPQTGSKQAKFYSAANEQSLGDSPLGDNPLGDGLALSGGDDATVPKFRCIRTTTPEDIFEYAIDIYSNTPDCRWEILTVGVNQVPSANHPTGIRK